MTGVTARYNLLLCKKGGSLLKINWKVRLRSGPFWAGLISLVLTFVYTVLNTFDVIPQIDQKQIMDMIVMLLQIFSFVGVVTDPTTKGLCDSEQAMTYQKPKE